jgi:hypothetical protein
LLDFSNPAAMSLSSMFRAIESDRWQKKEG